jgi:hypothetical protein
MGRPTQVARSRHTLLQCMPLLLPLTNAIGHLCAKSARLLVMTSARQQSALHVLWMPTCIATGCGMPSMRYGPWPVAPLPVLQKLFGALTGA